MAVHLKKRAYEEFNHVIQESSKPQLKKLRLTKLSASPSHPKFEDFQLEITGKTSQEVLQLLMDFSKKLPIPAEYVQQCLEKLKGHFLNERDSAVRMKIAWLLGQLCLTLDFYPVCAIEEIASLLDTEVSGKVLSQLWSSILSIALRLPPELSIHQQLLDKAYTTLNNHHQEVRCQCLKVIGNLATSKSSVKIVSDNRWDHANVHKLVADYFDDPEPRVRSTSLQAMILMHQRGQQLELSVYEQACSLLADDYEQVRFTAAQLVWILSHIYPESFVKAAYVDEKLRLIDDAFAKICDLLNDSSYKVRAEAARLLGSMHLVSDSFLFQTLDKKLMSDLRRKKSLNEQAKEGFVEEFASGTRWGEDAPRDLNPDATNLMHSGACGAFVHGLEDEMLEVRSAAVDSLTELASQRSNPSFAQAALDFLVDCLNDEIEAVRLNAVNSLHKIVQHVTLYEDQLDNVHSAMEDACKEIREGIHNLLSSCSLMSKACLFDTVSMLLKNLNKYPQDRRSVWTTQQKLGQHHSELVYLLVPQLLSCHPYFDTTEPQMDDPSYISILILVFNAAQSCPAMAQLFPEHVIRHYQYLKDSIPELVPQDLKLTTFTAGVDLCLRSPPRMTAAHSDPSVFLSRAISRVKNLHTYDATTQKTLLESTIRDLRHAAQVASSLSSTAQYSADFLEAQLLLAKAVDRKGWSGSQQICAQHMAFAKPAALQIIHLTFELEHLYLGLSTKEIAVIRQLRLKAQSLMFVLEMQEITQARTSCKTRSTQVVATSPTKLRDDFFAILQDLKTYLADRNIVPDQFSRTLFNEVLKVPTSKKTSLVVKLIQQLLSHCTVSTTDLNNKVQRSRAIIHEPHPTLDAPVILTAGLAASLRVDFTAENVANPLAEIQIKVTYPDSTEQIFVLRPSDIKQLSAFKHSVTTKVFLSHTQWTDSSVIKLSFLKVIPETTSGSKRDGVNRQILLCKPVQVPMHPKPPPRS